jgi:hypothetical protein
MKRTYILQAVAYVLVGGIIGFGLNAWFMQDQPQKNAF